MATTKTDYALGTYLVHSYPWGLHVSGAALCSDGKVRTLKRIAQTADTFFSVPASVRVKGRTVAGYVTVETVSGFSTPTDTDPAVVRFLPYTYRKNGELLPQWPASGERRNYRHLNLETDQS